MFFRMLWDCAIGIPTPHQSGSKTLYSGRAPSDTPGTDAPPSIHTVIYGGRPPLALVSMRMPRFADKDFTPFNIQSILVATMPYPSSPDSRASTTCFDLDAFVSEESGSSNGCSQTSMVERDRESASSGTSAVDEQSDLSCELSRFQPLNSPVSPIPDIYSQIVVESPSHYEVPDVPVAASALFDTVAHMSQVSALSSVLLSPKQVREDCTPGTTDVFPIYQVSPDNTGYYPRRHPLHHRFLTVSRFLRVRTFCRQERLGRLTASSDYTFLIRKPICRACQLRYYRSRMTCSFFRFRICAQRHLCVSHHEGLPGCPYRMTSYLEEDIADADLAYGVQLNHPRFLERVVGPPSPPVCWVGPGR